MTRHGLTSPSPDIDAVTALVEQVARDVILPKFNTLAAAEIERKATEWERDDLVTIVDRAAETRLIAGLQGLTPGVPVLGEEGAAAEPALLGLLQGDAPVWVVDPLDGTRNFAGGNDGFGVMVSWVVAGSVRAAWVHLPRRGETFVATQGGGAYLNGVPIRVPAGAPSRYRGMFSVRFLPEPTRARVLAQTEGRFEAVAASGAAAIAYTDVLRGRLEFVAYYRLLPWDHGAPALILTEAGGAVEHADGRPYSIRSTNQITIVARSAAVAREVGRWLADSDAGVLGDHRG